MEESNSALPLVESPGRELQALLWPVTPEAFVREYWARRPLYVKGFPEKYKGLFSREAFMGALSGPHPSGDAFLHASFDKKPGARRPSSEDDDASNDWASNAFVADPKDAVHLFEAGATLCASQMETRVAGLAPLVAAIKRQLGYPGKVYFNAYMSPAGAGFNWHFDARVASTLQIEGTKRWRFSNRAAAPWPRSNGALRADGTGQYTDPLVRRLEAMGFWQAGREGAGLPFDESDTTEVLLKPGDLLILPAGVWHDARAGATGSLALNLSFAAVPYTVLVRSLLDAILMADPAWRAPSPVLPLSRGAPGEVDPEGIAAIRAQLSAASDVLRALAGDSAPVVRLWASFVQSANPGFAAPAAAAVAPLSGTPVEPHHRLRVRTDGQVFAMLADGGSRLCLAVGESGSVEFIGEAVSFVQRLLRTNEFTAADCLTWSEEGTPFTWREMEPMLTKLKSDGLIEEAGSGRVSAPHSSNRT